MSMPAEEKSQKEQKQVFYITGLPRSRTAWLSVAMSDWRVSACLHEPLVRVTYGRPAQVHPIDRDIIPGTEGVDVAELARMLDATRCPRTGISDAGLPIVAPELPELMPGPILIVWRDPTEVIDSLTAYLGGDRDVHAGGVALMHQKLQDFGLRHKDRALIVNFEDLSSMAIMRSIWTHLLPGVPFQRRRIESLQRLRIDPDPARLFEGATESATRAGRRAMGMGMPTPTESQDHDVGATPT